MKIRIFTIILLVLATIPVYAGSISCATATSLAPDGRLLDFDSVQANTTNWYQFTATAGRSYSVEVRDDLDPNSTDLTVTYYGPNSTCSSLVAIPASIASVTDTHAMEPALPASAARSSIVTCPAANFSGSCTASGAGTYLIKVVNGSTTTSHYVSVGVTETTLYGELWTTGSGLVTQFNFLDTTSQNITCTLTLTAVSGAMETKSLTQTIGSGSSPFPFIFITSTGSVGVNTGEVGFATLVHNGPPGAIEVNAYWSNWGTTPVTIIPMPMGPMRGK